VELRVSVEQLRVVQVAWEELQLLSEEEAEEV